MKIVSKVIQVFVLCVAVTVPGMGAHFIGKTQATTAQGRTLVVSFSEFPVAPLPQTLQIASVTFIAHDPGNRVIEDSSTNERMYRFANSGVSIVLPRAAETLEFRLCTDKFDTFEIEALNSAGGSLLKQKLPSQNYCRDIKIYRNHVSIVRVTGGGGEGAIVYIQVGFPGER